MTNMQIVMLVLTSVFLFIFIGLHLSALPDVQKYMEIYDLMDRDVYKFEPHAGHSSRFRLYDYSIVRSEFYPSDACIIFFPDGDIKLNDNLYIWKSTMYGNIFRWYYHRKFCKLRDAKIDLYNWREMRERNAQHLHNAYIQQFKNKNKLSFKFLRG